LLFIERSKESVLTYSTPIIIVMNKSQRIVNLKF
jgi:hypothetical protein